MSRLHISQSCQARSWMHSNSQTSPVGFESSTASRNCIRIKPCPTFSGPAWLPFLHCPFPEAGQFLKQVNKCFANGTKCMESSRCETGILKLVLLLECIPKNTSYPIQERQWWQKPPWRWPYQRDAFNKLEMGKFYDVSLTLPFFVSFFLWHMLSDVVSDVHVLSDDDLWLIYSWIFSQSSAAKRAV